MRIAFFDIDGTLLHGLGSEKRFFLYLFNEGKIGFLQILAYLYFILRYFFVYKTGVFKKNKAYLYKINQSEIHNLSQDFVRQILLNKINPQTLSLLAMHKAAGDHIVLLSGTLESIAYELNKQLKTDDYIATRCQLGPNAKYTLLPPLTHPFAKDKLVLAKEYCSKHHFDLNNAYAYGDSFDDQYLLAEVKFQIVVNPDKKLEKLARSNNWQDISDCNISANFI